MMRPVDPGPWPPSRWLSIRGWALIAVSVAAMWRGVLYLTGGNAPLATLVFAGGAIPLWVYGVAWALSGALLAAGVIRRQWRAAGVGVTVAMCALWGSSHFLGAFIMSDTWMSQINTMLFYLAMGALVVALVRQIDPHDLSKVARRHRRGN